MKLVNKNTKGVCLRARRRMNRAKIAPRDGHSPVEQMAVTEPIEDGMSLIVHPTRLGGTRHLSAVQFVNDQRALPLVASHDGRFTVFSWSASDTIVHAH